MLLPSKIHEAAHCSPQSMVDCSCSPHALYTAWSEDSIRPQSMTHMDFWWHRKRVFQSPVSGDNNSCCACRALFIAAHALPCFGNELLDVIVADTRHQQPHQPGLEEVPSALQKSLHVTLDVVGLREGCQLAAVAQKPRSGDCCLHDQDIQQLHVWGALPCAWCMTKRVTTCSPRTIAVYGCRNNTTAPECRPSTYLAPCSVVCVQCSLS